MYGYVNVDIYSNEYPWREAKKELARPGVCDLKVTRVNAPGITQLFRSPSLVLLPLRIGSFALLATNADAGIVYATCVILKSTRQFTIPHLTKRELQKKNIYINKSNERGEPTRSRSFVVVYRQWVLNI